MVKEDGELDSIFQQFKEDRLKGRKSFALEDFEEFIIESLGGISFYHSVGGYQVLFEFIKGEEAKGRLCEIKSSPYNGRRPALRDRWRIISPIITGWDDQLIFRLSRYLDLNYYLKRPALQTGEMAERLFRVAEFMAEKDQREWASREERSLELFADEKYLASSAGKKLLNNIKLTLADLKAEKYSQMFVYWKRGTVIRRVLILENHSAFISCKRALEAGYKIFSSEFDTLIYGEGKHIIDSLQFLTELDTSEEIEIRYAGDMDPEGWLIYSSLKKRYPDYRLELYIEYYRKMLENAETAYPVSNQQQKNEDVLFKILEELQEKGENNMARKIERLWNDNLRLPQELITYEVIISQ